LGEESGRPRGEQVAGGAFGLQHEDVRRGGAKTRQDGIDPADEDGGEVGSVAVDGAPRAAGGGKQVERRAGDGKAGIGFRTEGNDDGAEFPEAPGEAGEEFVVSVVAGAAAEEARADGDAEGAQSCGMASTTRSGSTRSRRTAST